LPVGFSHTMSAGNKIAYFAYDPLSVHAASSVYYWYGFSRSAPQVQLLNWFDIAVGLEKDPVAVKGFELKQNYPNPFNPVTTIEYALTKAADVEIKVFDVTGKEVTTLVKGKNSAGNHTVTFDAKDLSSGLYVYTIKSAGHTSSKKMLLIK